MTGKQREPAEQQPTQAPEPGQQMADDGGMDRGLSGADIGDDGGEDPGGDTLGGG